MDAIPPQSKSGLTAFEKPWRRADTRLRVAEALLQRLRIEARQGPLIFVTPRPRALEYPREFETREPETLNWIEPLYYTMSLLGHRHQCRRIPRYAGLRPGIDVRAFEPAAASYETLCRNIEANALGERVSAYLSAGSVLFV